MTYYYVEHNGYREAREDVIDSQGRLTTYTRSRTPLRRVEGPVAGDGFLSVLAHIWLYTLLFLFLAWGVVSLIGSIGFLVVLVAAPILYVSFSRRMAGVRRFLRWSWRGMVGLVGEVRDYFV